MRCRQCGAEIADKALVCYRCGAATTEPTFKPPAARRRASPVTLVTSALALALLISLAIYLGRAPQGGGIAGSGSASWIVVAIAVAVVALRAIARRR
jgi:hypothetical protein